MISNITVFHFNPVIKALCFNFFYSKVCLENRCPESMWLMQYSTSNYLQCKDDYASNGTQADNNTRNVFDTIAFNTDYDKLENRLGISIVMVAIYLGNSVYPRSAIFY